MKKIYTLFFCSTFLFSIKAQLCTPTIVASSSNVCNGTSVTLTASGAVSYTWMPSGENANVSMVQPAATTIYTLLASAGICTSSATVEIVVYPKPTVSFSLQPDPTPHVWNAYPTYSGGVAPYTYLWTWGDGSPNDNTAYPSHSYSVAGTYSICVDITDANGCIANYCENDNVYRVDNTNSMVQVNVINTVTGIKQNTNLASMVSINPNPANDLIKIETGLTGLKTIELFDINGKLVLSKIITNNESINVAELSEGVYNLSIKLDNNLINKKIVIVR